MLYLAFAGKCALVAHTADHSKHSEIVGEVCACGLPGRSGAAGARTFFVECLAGLFLDVHHGFAFALA